VTRAGRALGVGAVVILVGALSLFTCRAGVLRSRGIEQADAGAPDQARDGRSHADGRGAPDARDAARPTSIWVPKPGTSWQWQITGTLDTSFDVQMYDIDLFDNTAATIAGLKAKGRIVICYLSVGTLESWRPDVKEFPPSVIGNPYTGWKDEKWLDVRSSTVRNLMLKRLDLAKSKGCDGVEPDNVEGFLYSTGFSLSKADLLDYNSFIAKAAHDRGLSVGLKNNNAQAAALQPLYDWELTEECVKDNDCNDFSVFIQAGKAVFHTEYAPSATKENICPKVQGLKFSTLIKNVQLDAWFQACP
jgi:endo-alpha-1,4-polygalactosaminidase (GH114 family)